MLAHFPEFLVVEAQHSLTNARSAQLESELALLTYDHIIELNTLRKSILLERKRCLNKEDEIFQMAFFEQDMLSSQSLNTYEIDSAFYIKREGRCGRCRDRLYCF